MHQDLKLQCMRLVATWELDCVKASHRIRFDRIIASTPNTFECLAIVSMLNLTDSDDEDYMDDLTYGRAIWTPICNLIDRCCQNTVSDPETYSHPLLNCCTDIFTKGMLDTIRGVERDIMAAYPKRLEIHEIVFLHDTLFYNDDISERWLHPFDRTLARCCYTLLPTRKDAMHDQVLLKMHKILSLSGYYS